MLEQLISFLSKFILLLLGLAIASTIAALFRMKRAKLVKSVAEAMEFE